MVVVRTASMISHALRILTIISRRLFPLSVMLTSNRFKPAYLSIVFLANILGFLSWKENAVISVFAPFQNGAGNIQFWRQAEGCFPVSVGVNINPFLAHQTLSERNSRQEEKRRRTET